MNTPKIGFGKQRITLPLDRILPVRAVKDPDKSMSRYQSIVSSIREIGVVEPLMVYPQKGNEGFYLLMDGHYRLHALRELGIPEAGCLVAVDDESFTYNARINRLSPIQEHSMAAKAVNDGVPVERIASALDKNVKNIKERLNILNGINPETVELLKEKQLGQKTLQTLRKVKPMRQLEIAELMVSANNYTNGYAEALLLGTPKDMLVDPGAARVRTRISREDLARMEMEMKTLESDYKAIEDNYADNMLNLTVLRGYVRKLLANPKIARFLGTRLAEMLVEFERIVAAEGV
ncbi:MAG: ParB N-terminal domain-containing protein [Verrucomicrobia bacterium]|nr:ParB N-terminal domain-containing protein [Verrucomicrobiota bacterium]